MLAITLRFKSFESKCRFRLFVIEDKLQDVWIHPYSDHPHDLEALVNTDLDAIDSRTIRTWLRLVRVRWSELTYWHIRVN